MEEKHPIDKFFSDGFGNPDIPFDEDAWTALLQKMRPRRRWPLLIGIGSGVAAAVVIAALLLFGEREPQASKPIPRTALEQPATPSLITPTATDSVRPDTEQAPKAAVAAQSVGVDLHNRVPADRPMAVSYVQLQRLATDAFPAEVHAVLRGMIPALPVQPPHTAAIPTETHPVAVNETPDRRWTLGIMAAPDLSGTQLFRGKLSGNIGLMATYRLNGRFSISAGALYAKKLYQADFADYRPTGSPVYAQYTPITVDADCNVLDIPVNINIDIVRNHRSTWFASTGISSYLMLRETYDYSYPSHQYGDLKQLTLHNQNRHILGVANLSVGYRTQLGGALSVTLQPFVKVPLTGIGDGKFKLYSSGLALSADIDLTRRAR